MTNEFQPLQTNPRRSTPNSRDQEMSEAIATIREAIQELRVTALRQLPARYSLQTEADGEATEFEILDNRTGRTARIVTENWK